MRVRDGSLWQVGESRFYCGSSLELWESGKWKSVFPRSIDCVYSDPPWNAGNRHMFETLAGRKWSDEGFDGFLTRLAVMLKGICPTGRLGIEMGLSEFGAMKRIFTEQGFYTHGAGDGMYGCPPLPNKIWYGSHRERLEHEFDVQSLHGAALSWYAINYILGNKGSVSQSVDGKGKVFCEPFCGKLLYAKRAIKTGMVAYGCELIPQKMQQGLETLTKRFDVKEIGF